MFDRRGPTFIELAQQALSSTTKGYDLLAPKFEYTPFRTPDELLIPLAEAVGGPIDRALDLCCGTGAAMRALRPLCSKTVAGIDLSQGMLDEAARLLEADETTQSDCETRLIQGDVLEMDFDEEFDVLTTCGAFGHILHHQQDEFAERVHRALVPGGCFLFVTGPMPPVASRAWWFSRTFNGIMHVRNALIKPPFIMFYLTFTLERAREVLERQGFTLDVRAPYEDTPYPAARLVIATK